MRSREASPPTARSLLLGIRQKRPSLTRIRLALDLSAGDITTFVPKASGRTRPDGDFKSSNVFDAAPFEDGKADATTNYPNGWGKWTKGGSNTENFNAH